jgi:hypothetical protein
MERNSKKEVLGSPKPYLFLFEAWRKGGEENPNRFKLQVFGSNRNEAVDNALAAMLDYVARLQIDNGVVYEVETSWKQINKRSLSRKQKETLKAAPQRETTFIYKELTSDRLVEYEAGLDNITVLHLPQ